LEDGAFGVRETGALKETAGGGGGGIDGEALQRGVGRNGFEELFGDAAAAVLFVDKRFGKADEGGLVGDGANEAGEFAGGGIGGERDGVVQGFVEDGKGERFTGVEAEQDGVERFEGNAGSDCGDFVRGHLCQISVVRFAWSDSRGVNNGQAAYTGNGLH
jgi:hypothetical protein